MSPPRAIYPFRADPGETATGAAVDAAAKLEALRASLGGKGAGLHVAAELGFRVPSGFTISRWLPGTTSVRLSSNTSMDDAHGTN